MLPNIWLKQDPPVLCCWLVFPVKTSVMSRAKCNTDSKCSKFDDGKSTMQIWLTHHSLKIENFKFGLEIERWMSPNPHQNLKFQIWPWHGKVTDTPHPHLKFQS